MGTTKSMRISYPNNKIYKCQYYYSIDNENEWELVKNQDAIINVDKTTNIYTKTIITILDDKSMLDKDISNSIRVVYPTSKKYETNYYYKLLENDDYKLVKYEDVNINIENDTTIYTKIVVDVEEVVEPVIEEKEEDKKILIKLDLELTSLGSNFISVVANKTTNYTNELYYSFSSDNGLTWSNKTIEPSHTFTNLESLKDYNIKVKLEINDENVEVVSNDLAIKTKLGVALTGGLIPIIWNRTGWLVVDEKQEWYSYESKAWANAITVKEEVRHLYIPGKEVEDNDVLAYYVFIPRYKYQLFNTGLNEVAPQIINIEFQNKHDLKEIGSKNQEWLTHPAFTFGNVELEGLWVGKFCITDTLKKMTILPNKPVIIGHRICEFFYGIQELSKENNQHGLSTLSDAHMIKNIEWGAMAYLSHSKYGIASQIRINNNKSMISGNGANEDDAKTSTKLENTYLSKAEQPQSSTGNVTGIYDMSGGALEYVMGVNEKEICISGLTTKFFLDKTNDKYYDNYASGETYNDDDAFKRRILGDGTTETRGWHDDHQKFVTKNSPWFTRSGYYYANTDAGAFYFGNRNGNADDVRTTRVVLIPTNDKG